MDDKALTKEALDRLAECRAQKALIELDLREGYFFTAPQRARDVSSMTGRTTTQRTDDASELQISLGIELASDFGTEILNTFMPETIQWVDQKPGVDLDPELWTDEVKEEVDGQTTAVMDAMKSSNLYATAALTFNPDLALGTVGMFIDDLRPSEPIVSMPVPIKEIEINVGPYGMVDDRFIVRHTKARNLPALLRGVELPADVTKKVKEKGSSMVTVTWGWWRLWDKDDDVYWQAVVMVDKTCVSKTVLKGEGSCPFVVGRFNPDVMFPWGQGPMLQSLPDLRRLDETEALKIENADFQIHPPFVYADDSVMNFSNGIEPGMGYPARPWAQGRPIEPLAFSGNVQFAEFETMRVEQRIRRLHFLDQPEQVGKTPPTAEQWLDEVARAKRRIGTPGKVFFREMPAELFLRFKYLLEKRGRITPVKIDGKQLSLVPYDPTEQAQEHQEVQIANRVLEMGRMHFPQTMQLAVDETATITNIKNKLRDKLVKMRSPAEMAAAVEQLAPVLGGGMAGPEGVPQ
jgi:hypothetical protein